MVQRGVLRSTLLQFRHNQIPWAQAVEDCFELCCSRDNRIAGVSSKGVVRYGNIDSGKCLITIQAQSQVSGNITAMDLSLDQSTIAVGFSSGLLKIFKTRNGALFRILNLPYKISKIAHSTNFVMILHDNGFLTFCTEKTFQPVVLEPALQIAVSPTITAILTCHSIVISYNDGLFTADYPIVVTDDDDLAMSTVSVYSTDSEHFITYSIAHHMTAMKFVIDGDVCSLIWQESLRFENPVKNLAIVNVLHDVPLILVLDSNDVMQLVIKTIILEWDRCNNQFMPASQDVKFFSWSLHRNALNCPGPNMSVTNVNVGDISKFLLDLQTEINVNLALAYADNIGTVLPVFQSEVISIIEIAVNRVRMAVVSGALTEQIKDLLQKLIFSVDKLTISFKSKKQYIASAMLPLKQNFENAFFEILDNTYKHIDLNCLQSNFITVFISQLIARQCFDKVKELVLRHDVNNLDFDDVVTILEMNKLWSSFVVICCRRGLSYLIFDAFEKVLQAGESNPDEIAFFTFLRCCFGLGEESSIVALNEAIAWLIKNENKALNLILISHSVEYLQILCDALSTVNVLLKQFIPLINASLTAAMTLKIQSSVAREIFELFAYLFRFQQYNYVLVWNNLFECLIYLINHDSYLEDSSPISTKTESCLNGLIRNIDPKFVEKLRVVASECHRLYVVALCAESQRSFSTLIRVFLDDNFPFTPTSIHFALRTVETYSDDLLGYDNQFLRKLYDRMFKSTPSVTVDCVILHPRIILKPEFSCELFLALVSKHYHNDSFMAYISHRFMTNFITSLVEQFSSQNEVCDKLCSNCLLSNDVFLEHTADTDFCLNVASLNNLIASKILLSLARKLPELAFIDTVGYIRNYKSIEKLEPFLKRVLQYAESFINEVFDLKVFPKLINELAVRIIDNPSDILRDVCERVFFTAVTLNAPNDQVYSMINSIASCFPRQRYFSIISRVFTELALSTKMVHILHQLVNQEGQEQLCFQLQVIGFEVENQTTCHVCNTEMTGAAVTVLDGKICHTACLQT